MALELLGSLTSDVSASVGFLVGKSISGSEIGCKMSVLCIKLVSRSFDVAAIETSRPSGNGKKPV
ncbi:MAG TPA: hypothetical protein PK625_02015, partial [Spirochaetales bacterium]|nr:hypothetical protein [Spirochaetales bacterium]